jgi:hypothetical protein
MFPEVGAMTREPRPRLTIVDAEVGGDGEPISVITRIWPRPAATRCTLCPRCDARPMLLASMCVVSTPGFIGNEEAAMHRFDAESGDEFPASAAAEVLWAELVEDD